MVKLFGWEAKMNQRVAEKREEELNWLWKSKMLDLLNGNLKWVPFTYSQNSLLIFITIAISYPSSR